MAGAASRTFGFAITVTKRKERLNEYDIDTGSHIPRHLVPALYRGGYHVRRTRGLAAHYVLVCGSNIERVGDAVNTTKRDLVMAAWRTSSSTQQECTAVIESFLSVSATYLRMGNSIELRGAFTLLRRNRASKSGTRNPKTGAPAAATPAHVTVKAKFPKNYLSITTGSNHERT